MTDEIKITKMPSFDTSNWFTNSSFGVSNYVNTPNFNVFEGEFSFNIPNFDSFNNSGYFQQNWNCNTVMPNSNFSFLNCFNFSSLGSFFPSFNWNFSFPKIDFSNFAAQSSMLPTESFWQKPSLNNTQRKNTAGTSLYRKNVTGKEDKSYLHLSKEDAYKKAEKDPNLEKLTGGKNWSVSDTSFKTDIPFAKKGTGAILDEVANMIGEKLVITSALGTGQSGNPHQKSGYASHHNAENPKLDIRAHGNAKELAAKLKGTGYFSWVLSEGDHVDVQIDPDKFKALA